MFDLQQAFIVVPDPFKVHEASLAFGRFLEEIGEVVRELPPTVAPNRLLEAEMAAKEEARFFLETVVPPDLAAQLGAEQRTRTRCANLWSSCVEVWSDAHGRADLTALAVASRERVLELERIASTVRGALGTVRGRPHARSFAVWHTEELESRGEPWFELFVAHAADLAQDPASAAPASPPCFDVDAARAGTTLREALGRIADARHPDPQDLVRVAALTIPGVSLTDAREVVFPRGLPPAVWTELILGLAGLASDEPALPGAVRLLPNDEPHWLKPARARAYTRGRLRREPAARLLQEPGTRLLWRAEVQAEVGRVIGSCLADADPAARVRLARCFAALHAAVRKRYRQTLDGRYERAALPLRLLAAVPTARESKPLGRATARCSGLILAARAEGDPAAEAQIHRWLAPYLDALPATTAMRLAELRAEFMLVTTVITFATLKEQTAWRAGKGADRLREICLRELDAMDARRAAAAKRAGTAAKARAVVERLERLAALGAWIRRRIVAASGAEAAGAADPEQERSAARAAEAGALQEIARLLDRAAPRGAGLRASAALDALLRGRASPARRLVARIRARRKGNTRTSERRADPFAAILVAQAAVLQAVTATESENHGVLSALRELADESLKEALTGLERPLRRRSYMVARLLLAFDLRLAQEKGPDMTFYGPVRELLEREGGDRAGELLRAALRDVAHRALLAAHLPDRKANEWRRVAMLTAQVPR